MAQGPPRVAPREYPADEVMESGGVSGYSGHRHRLASPVGIRPEPINASGSNGKLPGLGAMTGMPPSHEHGHHPRPEGPLPTRPGSYSPVQHASYGSTNGHMYPPSSHPGYHGHHTPNMGQMEQPRHPRLIVKSDSLKMEGRPELFLGKWRPFCLGHQGQGPGQGQLDFEK
jgi:hypothetical protein